MSGPGERDLEVGVGFLRGGARPPTALIVDYIEANREEFGVEPICSVLQVAPSTYYAHRSRPPSARSVSDAVTSAKIAATHAENYGVYGARKVHAELGRQGHRVARCTVERLMRTAGLAGISRAKGPRTTIAGAGRDHRADLVERQFLAAGPNRLWVADITYCRTFAGWVYAAFVIDVHSRRVVGWQLSTSLRTDLALDALEMGIWQRERAGADLARLGASQRPRRSGRTQPVVATPHDSGGVCDGTTSAASRQGSSAGDALAWSADPGPACAARVLAPDRIGQAQRRRCAGGRRVCAGWDPLVSSRWRHAAFEPCRADRPVLVLPRA